MKRRFLGLILVISLLVLPILGMAAKLVISSGELTSIAIVANRQCYFVGVIVATDGTNNVTVTIYDNTAASGTKVIPTFTVRGTDYLYPVLVPYVYCANGLYASFTGTGAKVTVLYTFSR